MRKAQGCRCARSWRACCSNREPVDALRDKFNVSGGWLPALTYAFEMENKMKKSLMIVVGVCFLLGGCGYTAWWWKAAVQARSFGASQTPTREVFQTQYKHLGRALSIIGVDLLAPADGDSSESPAKLIDKVFKPIRTHMLMGVLAAIAGLGTTIAALRMKGIRTTGSVFRDRVPQRPYSGFSGC